MDKLCSQSGEHRHQDATGVGSGVGLRAKADLTYNDCRTQVSLGQLVVRWHTAILNSAEEVMLIFVQYLLGASNSQMVSLGMDRLHDFGFDLLSLAGSTGHREWAMGNE